MSRIPKEKVTELHRKILLARLCEERIQKDYFDDEMKTPVHLGIGGEAIAIGVQVALPPRARIFATYRNHSIYLAASEDTDGFWAELYGRVTGCGKGKAGSMHMSCPEYGLIATSAVVGTTIPVAVGSAFASRYLKEKSVSVVFFGDGAAEEGVFYESLNFASLQKLPILFVIEDNDLAIHTKREARTGVQSFEKFSNAFDCHFLRADGTDALKVYETTSEILSMMATDPKPAILHLDYFRFLEHVGPLEDFKFGYREKPATDLSKFDPVHKLETAMLDMGFSEEDLSRARSSVLDKIEKSVNFAKASPFPEDHELYTDVLS